MKTLSTPRLVAVIIAILVAAAAIGYAVTQQNVPSAPSPVTTEPQPAPGSTGSGDCVIGGCSGELCTDANDEPAFSTCIYREEFACYKSSTCERQGNGQCGWTQTTELKACLENPPAIQ